MFECWFFQLLLVMCGDRAARAVVDLLGVREAKRASLTPFCKDLGSHKHCKVCHNQWDQWRPLFRKDAV